MTSGEKKKLFVSGFPAALRLSLFSAFCSLICIFCKNNKLERLQKNIDARVSVQVEVLFFYNTKTVSFSFPSFVFVSFHFLELAAAAAAFLLPGSTTLSTSASMPHLSSNAASQARWLSCFLFRFFCRGRERKRGK